MTLKHLCLFHLCLCLEPDMFCVSLYSAEETAEQIEVSGALGIDNGCRRGSDRGCKGNNHPRED